MRTYGENSEIVLALSHWAVVRKVAPQTSEVPSRSPSCCPDASGLILSMPISLARLLDAPLDDFFFIPLLDDLQIFQILLLSFLLNFTFYS